MYIPQRFIDEVDKHILGNMLKLPDFPLMLIINGAPGMGKTYQLRKYLKMVDVETCTMSAADMESYKAGEPANILLKTYIKASDKIKSGQPTVLVIDDIDLMLGEWAKNTGTVNHQTLLAFFMHIADNPETVEDRGDEIKVERVPIFLTGNYIEKMYGPLIRNGRANRFDWKPDRIEMVKMLRNIDILSNGNIAEQLVDEYPEKSIAFFSAVIANLKAEALTDITKYVVYRHILTVPDYKENIKDKYEMKSQSISDADILNKAREMSLTLTTSQVQEEN